MGSGKWSLTWTLGVITCILGTVIITGYRHAGNAPWEGLAVGSILSTISPAKIKLSGLFVPWDTMKAISSPLRNHHRFITFWVGSTHVQLSNSFLFLLLWSNIKQKQFKKRRKSLWWLMAWGHTPSWPGTLGNAGVWQLVTVHRSQEAESDQPIFPFVFSVGPLHMEWCHLQLRQASSPQSTYLIWDYKAKPKPGGVWLANTEPLIYTFGSFLSLLFLSISESMQSAQHLATNSPWRPIPVMLGSHAMTSNRILVFGEEGGVFGLNPALICPLCNIQDHTCHHSQWASKQMVFSRASSTHQFSSNVLQSSFPQEHCWGGVQRNMLLLK